jgi:hypothetical protein
MNAKSNPVTITPGMPQDAPRFSEHGGRKLLFRRFLNTFAAFLRGISWQTTKNGGIGGHPNPFKVGFEEVLHA